MGRNLLLYTDSYKQTHWWQYPQDVSYIYSYFEPRKGSFYDEIVWMGIEPYIHEYGLIGSAFIQEDIDELTQVCNAHFGIKNYPNIDGWEYILRVHNGRLPIRIWALPAGTIVAPGTPCMAIENTDRNVPWLTNFLESVLMHCWGMTTAATVSYDMFKRIKRYANITGEEVSPFHVNDFGVRGVPHIGVAELNGIGHLSIFDGTDNLPAIKKIKDIYADHAVYGASVVAAEHSTITAWGKDRECDAYRHIITKADEKFKGNFVIVSLVCDSYDWEYAVDNYFCGDLKDLILNRTGKVVCRPDSGYPPEVTLSVVKKLWDAYGGTITDNGYKLLDPHIGVIYGDHINGEMICEILNKLVENGFAVNNVIFGSGGVLLQKYNRDTCNCAIKLSNITLFNGTEIPICKTTIGKESKSGIFELPLVYVNGELVHNDTFKDIRDRLKTMIRFNVKKTYNLNARLYCNVIGET